MSYFSKGLAQATSCFTIPKIVEGEILISGQVVIEDALGFHARPAGQIVKLVKDLGFEVRIGKLGETAVKASSPLSLMSLKGKPGEKLVVEVDTDDQGQADQVITSIQGFLKG